MNKQKKVLVIGLDGGTPELVEQWMKAGYLPALTRIRDQGVYSRLESVMPVISSAAWSSFMTGMNPGKHGIYDFVRREANSYRLRVVTRENNRASSLWRILSRHGHRVSVINVPMTYPPEPVNGVLISGLGTPNYKPFTYPPELSHTLLERGYQVNEERYYKSGDEVNYLQELYSIVEKQFNSALWLMQDQEWDFFMLVFYHTDQITHYFWKYYDPDHPAHLSSTNPYADAILRFYQKLDGYIQTLIETAGNDTNVIVVSDHGEGPYLKDVFLNEWLRQQGYLATDLQGPRLHGIHSLSAKVGLTRDGISKALRRSGLGRIERWIKDILGDRIGLLPRSTRPEFPHAIDWTKTRAYSFGYPGQIYINLCGREPMGIIQPGKDYDAICQEISDRLSTFVDPLDGKPVVDRVIRREELFKGDQIDYAPDLTLVMRDFQYNTRMGYEFGENTGALFSEPAKGESASHRPFGIFFGAGPNFKTQEDIINSARLIDLAPTILHILGCPVPTVMDGAVLQDWLQNLPPIQYEDNSLPPEINQTTGVSLSVSEEAEITARLKDLGYLD